MKSLETLSNQELTEINGGILGPGGPFDMTVYPDSSHLMKNISK